MHTQVMTVEQTKITGSARTLCYKIIGKGQEDRL